MKKILIVEDDDNIHSFIKELLEDKYEVIDAFSGTEAIMILEKTKPDLILLDLMLPGLKGEEIIKKVSGTTIIVISAKASAENKVKNLLGGANDYITKPFDNGELLARIEVQLRNTNCEKSRPEFENLRLVKDGHTLMVGDKKVYLTGTEYSIVKQMIIRPHEILSKNRLLDLISMDTPDCDENSLKVHISNIRRKTGEFSEGKYINSVWGIGYRMSSK